MTTRERIPEPHMSYHEKWKKKDAMGRVELIDVRWVTLIHVFFSSSSEDAPAAGEGVKNVPEHRGYYAREAEERIGAAEHADACWCARDSGVPRFRGIDRLPPSSRYTDTAVPTHTSSGLSDTCDGARDRTSSVGFNRRRCPKLHGLHMNFRKSRDKPCKS